MLSTGFISTTITTGQSDRGFLPAWLERYFMTAGDNVHAHDDHAVIIDKQPRTRDVADPVTSEQHLREGLTDGEPAKGEGAKKTNGKLSREPLVRTLRKKKSSSDLRDVFQHGQRSPTEEHFPGDNSPTSEKAELRRQ